MNPRQQAAAILREARFHASGLPRPLHGIFRVLGGWLAPLGNWVIDQLRSVAIPSVLIKVIVLAILLIATRHAVDLRRRRVAIGRAVAIGRSDARQPSEVRRLASEAELRGDLASAVRLYFQGAVLGLQLVGRIPDTAALTVGEARRALGSVAFEAAAQSFESVVYGLRPPNTSDLAAVKGAWLELGPDPTR